MPFYQFNKNHKSVSHEKRYERSSFIICFWDFSWKFIFILHFNYHYINFIIYHCSPFVRESCAFWQSLRNFGHKIFTTINYFKITFFFSIYSCRKTTFFLISIFYCKYFKKIYFVPFYLFDMCVFHQIHKI